jgi:hypothetical protein
MKISIMPSNVPQAVTWPDGNECVYCSSDPSCNLARVAGVLVTTAFNVSSTTTPTPTPPMTTTALIADRACKASNVPASTPAAAKGTG